MSGMPTIFCPRCNSLRGITDWRERGEDMLIELEPCGHVAVRSARMEWVSRPAAA